MPRRAKIIFLGLFLILAGIPVTYALLSWSPKDPIRFKMIVYRQNAKFSQYNKGQGMLEVLLENTSRYPIQIYNASMFRDGDRSSAKERFFGSDEKGLGSSDLGVIAPGETLRTSIPWSPTVPMSEEVERMTACYHWMSTTKKWVFEHWRWRAPEFLRANHNETRLVPPARD
jgi:hypothetical protein